MKRSGQRSGGDGMHGSKMLHRGRHAQHITENVLGVRFFVCGQQQRWLFWLLCAAEQVVQGLL